MRESWFNIRMPRRTRICCEATAWKQKLL